MIKFDGNKINAIIDIGTICSLMNIATIEKLGLDKQIDQQPHYHLIDATENNM